MRPRRRAREIAGAAMHSTNNFEMIERPEVTTVFVSTPEGEHAAADHSRARAR